MLLKLLQYDSASVVWDAPMLCKTFPLQAKIHRFLARQ